MTRVATDLRLLRAEGLLQVNGMHARVSSAGQDDDVLTVRVPLGDLEPLRELAPELKALGFTYITIELNVEDSSNAG